MNAREHARLARSLIAACGGLEEASRACRVSRSVLSTYQQPTASATMPADVVCDLEAYCGAPIYSRALAARFDERTAGGDLRASACALTEEAADLQGLARSSLAAGRLSPRELDALTDKLDQLEGALKSVRSVLRGADVR